MMSNKDVKMRSGPKGQALVIVLLILGVVLTVGLSVVSQAINDVRLSEREEEASRAFSAAESGVEQALTGGIIPPGPQQVGNATYRVDRTLLAGGPEFLFPNDYVSGDAATLYLVEHNNDGSLDTGCPGNCFAGTAVRVCWATEGTDANLSVTPALEVGVLYLESGIYKLSRLAIDPNTSRLGSNSFTAMNGSDCTVSGRDMEFSHFIPFSSLGMGSGRPVLMRLKLHYNYSSGGGDVPHPIGVVATGGNFPSQGVVVESVGTFGDATQKVQVTQLHPDAPPIFDYALYAESGGLIK